MAAIEVKANEPKGYEAVCQRTAALPRPPASFADAPFIIDTEPIGFIISYKQLSYTANREHHSSETPRQILPELIAAILKRPSSYRWTHANAAPPRIMFPIGCLP
jgi:hypothetical protein